ncbi:MAG: MBL fold metallo-hydrolase [Myxococcales bacterium]|nr:MBL fold metallo-hydrolase [Myxococcales bacterium]
MAGVRKLTSIAGNSQRLDGGAMFGNAPKALWSRWCTPDDQNRIALSCRALLVQDGDRNILFEAGIGVFFEPKMKERYGVVEDEHVLLKSLASVGLSPSDIDVVVLSHMHFDHVGGLLTSYSVDVPARLVFEGAAHVVGKEAWLRCKEPHSRDRASFIPGLAELLESNGRLEIVAGNGCKLLGEGFRFHHSSGHTPGMMLSEVKMPDGPVLFAADLIPGTPWVHLPITMGYDRYPELLIEEKEALLRDLLGRGGRLFYTHDSECALSSIERDLRGRFGACDQRAQLVELDH